jgi:hypothetical protein
MLHLTLASAAVALLGACTPGRISYVHVDSAYTPQQYSSVPYTKALRADVSGNPFNMPQEDFNRLVNEAIQPPGVVPSAASPYVIHFAFGTEATSINYACTAPGRAGHGGGAIAVTAAFCRGPGAALTYLAGSVDDITGPEDPRFRQFLRTMVARLFPMQTDDTRENDNCFVPGC